MGELTREIKKCPFQMENTQSKSWLKQILQWGRGKWCFQQFSTNKNQWEDFFQDHAIDWMVAVVCFLFVFRENCGKFCNFVVCFCGKLCLIVCFCVFLCLLLVCICCVIAETVWNCVFMCVVVLLCIFQFQWVVSRNIDWIGGLWGSSRKRD